MRNQSRIISIATTKIVVNMTRAKKITERAPWSMKMINPRAKAIRVRARKKCLRNKFRSNPIISKGDVKPGRSSSNQATRGLTRNKLHRRTKRKKKTQG